MAVDVDGSEDLANSWVDLRNVTQYPNAANTQNDKQFPKYLQFGGHGTNREFSTAEIGEFIAFDKVLSEEERQKVEGYLVHRGYKCLAWTQATPMPVLLLLGRQQMKLVCKHGSMPMIPAQSTKTLLRNGRTLPTKTNSSKWIYPCVQPFFPIQLMDYLRLILMEKKIHST